MAGYFSTGTFRTIGSAATTQNLFTLTNTDATKLIYIRRLILLMDSTVLSLNFMPVFKTVRTSGANPSGGTQLTKVPFRTTNVSNANTIALGANAVDAGAATAITATAGVATIWQQMGMRVASNADQVLGFDNNMLPMLIDTRNLILRQNQSILVYLSALATTLNPTTNHYIVNCVWEEN